MQEGLTFHGCAVVAVQDQACCGLFFVLGDLHQLGGMLSRFLRVNLPCDDLAAIQVLHAVQIVVLSSRLTRLVGDVPCPDLIRGCRSVGADWSAGSSAALASTVGQLVGLLENAVEAAL